MTVEGKKRQKGCSATHQNPSPSPGLHPPAQPIAHAPTAPQSTQHAKSATATRLANDRAARQVDSCARCEKSARRGLVRPWGLPSLRGWEPVQGSSESSEERDERDNEEDDVETRSAPSTLSRCAAARRRSSRMRRLLLRRFALSFSRRCASPATACTPSKPPKPGRNRGSTTRLTLMPPPCGPPGPGRGLLPPPNQPCLCGGPCRAGCTSGNSPGNAVRPLPPTPPPPYGPCASCCSRRRRYRHGRAAKRYVVSARLRNGMMMSAQCGADPFGAGTGWSGVETGRVN